VDGVARVRLDGTWGLVRSDGSWAVKPVWDEIDQASEGLWPARSGKLWGFIDSRGTVAIAPRYAKSSDFHSGLARERDQVTGLWGYIDTRGSWVVKAVYRDAEDFESGLSRVKAEKGQWMLLAADGTVTGIQPCD
jgi:hypothetical protein